MVDYETICEHEAAHAVMRYLLGHPCTAVSANENEGVSYGSGNYIKSRDAPYISLAGFAYEAGLFCDQIDLSSSVTDDFDDAREILQKAGWLRLQAVQKNDGSLGLEGSSVDASLKYWFIETGEIISPYQFLIIDLSSCVADDFDDAREILQKAGLLRLQAVQKNDGSLGLEGSSVDASLKYWFIETGEIISPYQFLIIDIGWRLQQTGFLSARSVAAIIREFFKRIPISQKREVCYG